MKLRPDQLPAHLKNALAPIYFISGDEPLQVMEAADTVRAAARAAGCEERLVFTVEPGFDWGVLLAARDSLSLFAARRLVELRIPGGKPGDAGSKALVEYAARPPESDVLLITAPKLESAAQRSKWYGALERAGAVVSVWPVEVARLPAWVAQRARARGLRLSREAAALIAARGEGNLLACAQEIDKLHLLHGAGDVDGATAADSVADSARFSIYDLADAALAGDAARTVRVLDGLRGEGVEPVLILWAVAREIRALAGMSEEARLQSPARVLAAHRVWERRKPQLTAALKRHGPARWRDLLQQAAHVDRITKGAAPGNAWDELLQLALVVAGVGAMRDPMWCGSACRIRGP